MDLSLAKIYSSAFRGLRKHTLVYFFLFIWTMIMTVLMVIFSFLGSSIYLGSILAISFDKNAGSSAFYISAAFFGIMLFVSSIIYAATKAGFMAFGSAVRMGETPTPLHFFRGIIKFTVPLFIGGIVVSMLTSIPFLAFIAFTRISLTGAVPDLFTSGWNFQQAIELVQYIWSAAQIAALCNVIIFFWISPWDEMVVLYELPYPEALMRSFTFVFSRRHFLRVLMLIAANILLSQAVLIITNFPGFQSGLQNGFGFAYVSILLDSQKNIYTTFIQLILFPFFIYTQLYLLPWPSFEKAAQETGKTEIRVTD